MTSRKIRTAALAAFSLCGAALATADSAEAGWRYRHRGYGGAVAAGVIGGLALGALAASAARPAYAEPVYAEPLHDEPICYVVKRRHVNAWGELVVRREEICE